MIIKKQVWDQVSDQAWVQVRNRVYDQVWVQVLDQVYDQMEEDLDVD